MFNYCKGKNYFLNYDIYHKMTDLAMTQEIIKPQVLIPVAKNKISKIGPSLPRHSL